MNVFHRGRKTKAVDPIYQQKESRSDFMLIGSDHVVAKINGLGIKYKRDQSMPPQKHLILYQASDFQFVPFFSI